MSGFFYKNLPKTYFIRLILVPTNNLIKISKINQMTKKIVNKIDKPGETEATDLQIKTKIIHSSKIKPKKLTSLTKVFQRKIKNPIYCSYYETNIWDFSE